ncbi:MAG: MBL fold metallo-hydrolase, partial [Desulfobacteraceae bacterium]|nr:MBL fold metallo-hydrolase [Desulfobacteraceae bacterium]
ATRVAIAIDPGAVDSILSYLEEHHLTLEYIANTHSHYDHTPGNREIVKRTGAMFLPNQLSGSDMPYNLRQKISKSFIRPDIRKIRCVLYGKHLITGDTLFNGTIGNCFSGDVKSFYTSIKLLMNCPENTVIYAGHDYVRASMEFARFLEPDNPEIPAFLNAYNPYHVFSTLAQESRLNPYLRFNEPSIIGLLESKKLPTVTEYDRWKSLMTLE